MTPSALKAAGLKPWIHHTHTKPEEDQGQEWRSRANLDQPLKLTLTRGSPGEVSDGSADPADNCDHNDSLTSEAPRPYWDLP
jgi:hypothetical protein